LGQKLSWAAEVEGGSWRLGGRDKGAATNFVCWAESSHGLKMGKGKGKRLLFVFREYFRERNNLEIAR
jgi:hypothetical protein